MLPNPLSPSTTLPTFLTSLRTHTRSPTLRIWLSFFILGLINNVLYVIILSAALDLVGPSIPKALVLLFDVAPSFVIKLTAPYFIHRVPYSVRVWACVVVAAVGMAAVALSPSSIPHPRESVSSSSGGGSMSSLSGASHAAKEKLNSLLGNPAAPPAPPAAAEILFKMGGIAMASLASGAGELSFLALTSFYGQASLAAWGSGTGAAGLVGAGAYVLATTTLGLSVRTSLVVFSFLPLGMLAAYFVVLPAGGLGVGRGLAEGYAPIASGEEGERREREGDEEQGEESRAETGLLSGVEASNVAEARKGGDGGGFVAKLRRARSLVFPYMLPLFLVYLSEYTINQGVTPTLLYPLDETPFKHFRDFYPTYGTLYQAGVFVSRSSLPFLRIQSLYIPSILQWGNLFLLVAQAMYFTILPNVWLVFLVIFWEGLLGGLVYVSTFRRIGEEVPPEDREFSLAATTVSDSAGICLASFLGMVVETSLCKWQQGRGRDWCTRL